MITVFSIVGLVWDGYQASDFFFGISLVLWLYLPECDRAENIFLNWLKRGENNAFKKSK